MHVLDSEEYSSWTYEYHVPRYNAYFYEAMMMGEKYNIRVCVNNGLIPKNWTIQ